MNFLDILILIPLVIGAWRGFKKGFIIELFTFLALFLGLYAGIHFSDYAANAINESMEVNSDNLPVIAFTVTFLLIGAMVYFAGKAIEKAIKVVQLSLLNKAGGAFFGMLKMALFAGGVILLLQSYDEKADLISEETKKDSLLLQPIQTMTMFAIPAFEESTIFLKNALKDKDLFNVEK
ncbi:MAG: CvpA family protein [Crocinitomicaceae bacterium]|nr:CvpA family protein [Crocinitomicaceae bacterium]